MKKAFTLIEVLVSVAIFSFALVISSGVFSQVLGNQSYMRVNAEVNKESSRITRQISDDVVNAIGVGSVSGSGNTAVNGWTPHGILFISGGVVKTPNNNCLIVGSANCQFDGFVLFGKDNLKIYRLHDNNIEYSSSDSSELKLDTSSQISPEYQFNVINSDKVEISINELSGLACYNANCSSSPFVRFNISTRTKNFNNLAAKKRASLSIESLVSIRSL